MGTDRVVLLSVRPYSGSSNCSDRRKCLQLTSIVLLKEKIKCYWFGIALNRKRKSLCGVVGVGVAGCKASVPYVL